MGRAQRTGAHTPFLDFARGLRPQSVLRAAITAAYRRPEPECVAAMLDAARLPGAQARSANALARRLAQQLRHRGAGSGRTGLVQGLVHEFSLSSQEGVALMCLAEALLRIPDAETRDALIRDKIGRGDWSSHLGGSRSLFVNAATWGLIVTGKLIATHTETGLAGALARVVARSGEPVVRTGVDMAMRLLGEQFVTGETIDEALANAQRREAQGFRHSYDMLGEAALTDEDAQRYLAAYRQAIDAIGRASAGRGVLEGPGISIKLSALHPRFARAQYERTMAELYPRLFELALQARSHGLGLNIDAEEADRLELSLDLLERLCFEPGLDDWNGIGFVVQAYQKRCPQVVDYLIDLARRSGHRLMVRLVKGAYWDSEIKRAQLDGLEGYPVFTRKAHTDLAYIGCARRLLAAADFVYPQFATHNAHTLAAVHEAAGPDYYPGQYEFQCLHGMGEPLYEQVVRPVSEGGLGRPCRIYAPVGSHQTLLAYLVRRLLENGANTSFVNRIADEAVSIDELVADPVATVAASARAEGTVGLPHPAIPLPSDICGAQRRNSAGLDLSNEHRLASLSPALLRSAEHDWLAAPLVGEVQRDHGPRAEVRNPADHRDTVGHVVEASVDDVVDALAIAVQAAPHWAAIGPAARAAALVRASELLEARSGELIGLLVREAGKTFANAISEIREAVDFLRYYAAQVRDEAWIAGARPLGPIACISPWNFPLAIFTGQVAAALAVGNTVLAKPAEQTPLVAAEAVRLLRAAGVPPGALQLLPGRGETVGAALVGDERIRGVIFTGSTEVARVLQRQLAGRLDERGMPLTLIAETGGQNAMIVDSSALAEQAVADIVASAFDSAGQRCSALRVLCLQEDTADHVLTMLRGAVRQLSVGSPERLSTDVGPVIDADARQTLLAHVETMRERGHRVHQSALADADALPAGTFVLPTLIELDSVSELGREVFGPVLHVVRFARRELARLIDEINATGYALTLGIQTRIDETVEFVTGRARAGNQYVNRNIIGAVVGVQPFGGHGLSGTGPKAGGPLYLYRLVHGGESPLAAASAAPPEALLALQAWLERGTEHLREIGAVCAALARSCPVGLQLSLPGPTGERNDYALLPREAVLCIAGSDDDRLFQLAHVLAAGARAVWPDDAGSRKLLARLPAPVQRQVRLAAVARTEAEPVVAGDLGLAAYDAVLVHGEAALVRAWSRRLAEREGPIVSMQACAPGQRSLGAIGLEWLMTERSLSVNTAAAGGNASLMTIG